MPKARRTSYNLAFKLKVIAEAEAVENNSEIAREYGISESMVRRWRKDEASLFNGEIKLKLLMVKKKKKRWRSNFTLIVTKMNHKMTSRFGTPQNKRLL